MTDRTKQPAITRWQYLQQLFYAIAAMASVGAAFVHAWRGDLVAFSTLVAAGVGLYLISNLNRMASFEMFGIKGKMRDIDTMVDQAKLLLDRLKTHALVGAELVVYNATTSGRLVGPLSQKEQHEKVRRVVRGLQELGIDLADIKPVIAPWIDMTTLLLMRQPLELIYQQLNGPIHQNGVKLNEFASPSTLDSGNTEYREALSTKDALAKAHKSAQASLEIPVLERAAYVSKVIHSIPDHVGLDKNALFENAALYQAEINHIIQHGDLGSPELVYCLPD